MCWLMPAGCWVQHVQREPARVGRWASKIGVPALPAGLLGPVFVAVPLNRRRTALPCQPRVGYGEPGALVPASTQWEPGLGCWQCSGPGRHDSPRLRPDDGQDARPLCDPCLADVEAHATNWTDVDDCDPTQ